MSSIVNCYCIGDNQIEYISGHAFEWNRHFGNLHDFILSHGLLQLGCWKLSKGLIGTKKTQHTKNNRIKQFESNQQFRQTVIKKCETLTT